MRACLIGFAQIGVDGVNQYPTAGVTVSLISTELTCYVPSELFICYGSLTQNLNFTLRWEWEQIFGRLWLPDKVSGIVEWRI